MSFNVDIQGHHTNDAVSIQLLIKSVDDYNSDKDELLPLESNETDKELPSFIKEFNLSNSILIVAEDTEYVSCDMILYRMLDSIEANELEKIVALDFDEYSIFVDRAPIIDKRITNPKEGLKYLSSIIDTDQETYVFINDLTSFFFEDADEFINNISQIINTNPFVHIIGIARNPKLLCSGLVDLFGCRVAFKLSYTKSSRLLFSDISALVLSDDEYLVSYDYGETHEKYNLPV